MNAWKSAKSVQLNCTGCNERDRWLIDQSDPPPERISTACPACDLRTALKSLVLLINCPVSALLGPLHDALHTDVLPAPPFIPHADEFGLKYLAGFPPFLIFFDFLEPPFFEPEKSVDGLHIPIPDWNGANLYCWKLVGSLIYISTVRK